MQSPANTLSISNGSGPLASLDVADSAIVASKIRDGAITLQKLAPSVLAGLTGAAGGDLAGNYPNPTIKDLAVKTGAIADDAVTNAKIANDAVTATEIAADAVTSVKIAADAVTSAKIANGTIVGADINGGATISVGGLGATGNVGAGTITPASRLSVVGAGSTQATNSIDAVNSIGAPLLTVRDDGNIGIRNPNPAAALDVSGGVGTALLISSGASVFSFLQLGAGANVTIPRGATVVRIIDDGVNVPITVNMPVALPGQVVIISNDDVANLAGVVVAATPINPGQTRMFVFTGAGWRLVN